MTKETKSQDKRDTVPFITFRPRCGLNFQDRLCWSLLVYRRRKGHGCKEHEIVTRTRLSRKGVHAALGRLAAMKLVFERGGKHYPRRPRQEIAALKKNSGGERWYRRFAYWKCRLGGRPVEDVLLGLLGSLARGGLEARGQSDAGLASLLGVHPKTVGRTLARLEGTGRLRLVRRGLRYDVCLAPPKESPPETGRGGGDSAFEPAYRLLRELLVPRRMVEKEIMPLADRVAASDQSFGPSGFLSLIEAAAEQHAQTGTTHHPGHLVRHKLRQALAAEVDVGARLAEARYDRHMAEVEAQCQTAEDYWTVIGYLGKIDHIECCGGRIKLAGGREMASPTADQTRIANAVKEPLPGVRVVPKQYRLRCSRCGVTHDCLTVDVFATIDGWSSCRHVPVSLARLEPPSSKVTVTADTTFPDTLLVTGSRAVPYSSGQDENEQDFLALLDAAEEDAVLSPESPSPGKGSGTSAGGLIPKALSDDVYHRRKVKEDMKMLRPALAAALTRGEDEEDQDTHEEIFQD